MSEDTQVNIIQEKLLSNTALSDPSTLEGIENLLNKTLPLVQAGRFDHIIDLLSLISDNIEFLDEAALEKTTKAGEEILGMSWTLGNSIRMASAQTQALETPPSIYQVMKSFNDPDVRRSLHFMLGTLRILGQQMKSD